MNLSFLRPKSIRAAILIVSAIALLGSEIIGIVIYGQDRESYQREVEGADLQRRIELVRKAIAAASPAEREIMIRALRSPDFNIQIAPAPPAPIAPIAPIAPPAPPAPPHLNLEGHDWTRDLEAQVRAMQSEIQAQVRMAQSDLQNQIRAAQSELRQHIHEAEQQMHERLAQARDQLGEANRRAADARREAMRETDPEARQAALEEAKDAENDAAEAQREIQRLTRQLTEKIVRLSMKLPNEQVLQVTAAPVRASFDYGRFLAIFLTTATMILLLGWWATSRVTKPLALFGAAAERLGRNVDAPPMPEDGPDEVRKAAEAFNRMQDRIRRFVQDRTTMLAAISHDLRTPLTRMRLRAEFVTDDEDRAKLVADLDEMEAMISEALAFARNEAEAEAVTTVDLQALAEAVANDQQAVGAGVAIEEGGIADVLARPTALKRALTNLVRNAVIYGGGAAVKVEPEQDGYVILVQDNGPGIPEADLDRVFTPFLRLEESRNKSSGGVGLGLSIARSTARAHGGDVRLLNRPGGGLEARLFLPAAPSGV